MFWTLHPSRPRTMSVPGDKHLCVCWHVYTGQLLTSKNGGVWVTTSSFLPKALGRGEVNRPSKQQMHNEWGAYQNYMWNTYPRFGGFKRTPTQAPTLKHTLIHPGQDTSLWRHNQAHKLKQNTPLGAHKLIHTLVHTLNLLGKHTDPNLHTSRLTSTQASETETNKNQRKRVSLKTAGDSSESPANTRRTTGLSRGNSAHPLCFTWALGMCPRVSVSMDDARFTVVLPVLMVRGVG